MHFFLYQQVIQTVAQVAPLLSQQNNKKTLTILKHACN